ncbi:dephospho-CoA kinase [Thermodesulfatator indicus DSM 15286]|uniref:Dephospho-CoA kinase n=1 Tax=Thermodesulfatator indicus (strain DSM 15286 / JCM 11887 / CIR29812) TaxID=667014 RepID=F8AC91_THEID|nr:dephospho-CoA kinase [Thermodesulfatator indicus]AEH45726.1 dephospho-CoA kinase [Thermodesulfatator indicus DSM 15286]
MEHSNPIKIAITGPPAAGKTTVLSIFAQKGVPVFSADEEVKRLSQPCKPGFHLVVKKLGKDFLTKEGQLNRRKLLHAMLADPKTKKTLEEIFHPLVKKSLLDWFEKNKDKPLLVAEIPLLYQGSWEKIFDRVIWVTVPQEVLLERLSKRLKDERLAKDLLRCYQKDLPEKIFPDLVIESTSPLSKIEERIKNDFF